MITKETLDSVKEETVNADTSGLLIELEGAVWIKLVAGNFCLGRFSAEQFRPLGWIDSSVTKSPLCGLFL